MNTDDSKFCEEDVYEILEDISNFQNKISQLKSEIRVVKKVYHYSPFLRKYYSDEKEYELNKLKNDYKSQKKLLKNKLKNK